MTIKLLAALLAVWSASAHASASPKRGLCFTPNENHPDDNRIWIQPGSDLTWYYNYQSFPSPAYAGKSQEELEFVPMMWGLSSDPSDTSFLDQVKSLQDGGRKIHRVLAFNEPDADHSVGGSNVSPQDAAQAWVANFEPLGKMGIKRGLPACTGGPGGLPWLEQFLGNCSNLVSTTNERKNCTWEFLPVHWYDNFAGLASHIGERRATWPEAEIWVTEYAYAHQDLGPTQDFFKEAANYLDRLDYVGGYSYFGAFRANKANVGPNTAFLSNGGQLTDIGSWYLGFGATGVSPLSGKASTVSPGTKTLMATLVLAAPFVL